MIIKHSFIHAENLLNDTKDLPGTYKILGSCFTPEYVVKCINEDSMTVVIDSLNFYNEEIDLITDSSPFVKTTLLEDFRSSGFNSPNNFSSYDSDDCRDFYFDSVVIIKDFIVICAKG